MNEKLVAKRWTYIYNMLTLKRKNGLDVWAWGRAFIAVRVKNAKSYIWRQVRGSVNSPYIFFKGQRFDVLHHTVNNLNENYIIVPHRS
jgi:hypothetical protein